MRQKRIEPLLRREAPGGRDERQFGFIGELRFHIREV